MHPFVVAQADTRAPGKRKRSLFYFLNELKKRRKDACDQIKVGGRRKVRKAAGIDQLLRLKYSGTAMMMMSVYCALHQFAVAVCVSLPSAPTSVSLFSG